MARTRKKSRRGFAAMSEERVSEIGQKGGRASPTKFEAGDPRTIRAAHKGGQARAQDRDVKSGKLGRMGAAARWHKN